MYEQIIVPIDVEDAEKGKKMLGKAKDLADGGAKVTAVYVVEDVPGLFTAELPDGLVVEVGHKARDSLLDMVKSAGLTADVEIRSGRPHHAIVSLADQLGADLIMIASHTPGPQDYLLGSTAASVVRHAKCSVLVQR